jgi:1-aminocyclopropane-1-carboxylate deaminase/D-cysteine desulfhydrase-like pyridoxal-dependent ACC family enzyme
LVQKTADLLDHALDVKPEDIIVNEHYLGPAYAVPTPEGNAAIRTMAQMEGVFLDPVYTGKTMAGLFDLTRRREIPRGSTVVFWHTGGIPGLFGLAKSFQSE